MRVLVCCIPQSGHITPVLPLAEAFSGQGDDVLLASGPEAESAAVGRGLGFAQVCPGYDNWFRALRDRTRGMPGDGLPPARIEGYFLPRLFGEVGTALTIDGLLETAREFRPDLIVFDPLVFAAPLVGCLLGVPVVQHAVGLLNEPTVLDLVADAVSPIWREFGLQVPDAAGVYDGTTVAICPPSLDPSANSLPRVRWLRPTPVPEVPSPSNPVPIPRAGQPLIYLTLGTFSNNLGVFSTILDALADEPVNVIATIGSDQDPADLAPSPPNAVVERFVPQAQLLPHCTAAVHHAGAGTTFGILAHGLPSVALPQSADNFRIAERIAKAGAAHTIMPGELDADAIREGVQTAIGQSSFRQAASTLATEIASMPEAAEVARLLGTDTADAY